MPTSKSRLIRRTSDDVGRVHSNVEAQGGHIERDGLVMDSRTDSLRVAGNTEVIDYHRRDGAWHPDSVRKALGNPNFGPYGEVVEPTRGNLARNRIAQARRALRI